MTAVIPSRLRLALALVCPLVVIVVDRWAMPGVTVDDYTRPSGSLALAGAYDELAHFAVGLLVALALLPLRSRAMVVGCLVGSVVIDLDHLPVLMGVDLLQHPHSGRPVTHSLATVAVIVVAALVAKGSPRRVATGLAIGVAAHLIRDLTTGGAVPLMWPLSDAAVHRSNAILVVAVICLGVIAATRAAMAGSAWPGPPLRRGRDPTTR